MSEPVRGPQGNPQGDPSNRRNHYRIEYPVLDRPELRAGAIEGRVADCSEAGVRVMITNALPPEGALALGARFSGTIRFSNGDSTQVEGEVVRVDPEKLVLHLDTRTIPFGKLIKQQVWLHSKYPGRDR